MTTKDKGRFIKISGIISGLKLKVFYTNGRYPKEYKINYEIELQDIGNTDRISLIKNGKEIQKHPFLFDENEYDFEIK